MGVAPYAGAWIESMDWFLDNCDSAASLPTRERGLKGPWEISVPMKLRVAPYAGAWIERIVARLVSVEY